MTSPTLTRPSDSTVSGDLVATVSSVVVDARAARPEYVVYLLVPLPGGNNDVAEAIGPGATAASSEPGPVCHGAAHILVPTYRCRPRNGHERVRWPPFPFAHCDGGDRHKRQDQRKLVLRHILCSVGYICGPISTVGAGRDDQLEPTGFTTPPSCALQPLLARMLAAGATHVSLEASSHGRRRSCSSAPGLWLAA